MPILYSFRRCPYAMRARLALAVSGQSCVLREVALRDRPAELYAVSPKGTVPVLVLGERVIDESLDIMKWALQKADPEGWLLPGKSEFEAAERLIEVCDGKFKFNLDRYKYSARHEPARREEFRELGAVFLRSLEEKLAKNAFLFGPARSLADQAIAPFVRQYALTDRDWFEAQDWPHLALWLEAFVRTDLWGRVMTKFPVWNPDDTPLRLSWI